MLPVALVLVAFATAGIAAAETGASNGTTCDGMEIHFEDYQFAHGLPVITVPWSQLTDLLAPDLAVLAH